VVNFPSKERYHIPANTWNICNTVISSKKGLVWLGDFQFFSLKCFNDCMKRQGHRNMEAGAAGV
jgi:hypothetical protein